MGQIKNLEIESKECGIFKNVEMSIEETLNIKDFHDTKNARAGNIILKNISEMIYLDYFNNFLSTQKFAEYYGLSLNQAKSILSIGRKAHIKKHESKDFKKGKLK